MLWPRYGDYYSRLDTWMTVEDLGGYFKSFIIVPILWELLGCIF